MSTIFLLSFFGFIKIFFMTSRTFTWFWSRCKIFKILFSHFYYVLLYIFYPILIKTYILFYHLYVVWYHVHSWYIYKNLKQLQLKLLLLHILHKINVRYLFY